MRIIVKSAGGPEASYDSGIVLDRHYKFCDTCPLMRVSDEHGKTRCGIPLEVTSDVNNLHATPASPLEGTLFNRPADKRHCPIKTLNVSGIEEIRGLSRETIDQISQSGTVLRTNTEVLVYPPEYPTDAIKGRSSLKGMSSTLQQLGIESRVIPSNMNISPGMVVVRAESGLQLVAPTLRRIRTTI